MSSSVQVSRAFDGPIVEPLVRFKQWLTSLAPTSRRKYLQDLTVVARFMEEPTPMSALQRMLGMKRARILMLLESFRDDRVEAGWAPATINGALTTCNSALRAFARADLGPGPVDITMVPWERRRDVRGPGLAKVIQVLRLLKSARTPLGLRNRAIMHLAIQRGLRSIELCRLKLDDVDLDAKELAVQRKGRREKQIIKIAPICATVLQDWMQARSKLGHLRTKALFVTIGSGHLGNPTTPDRILRIVRECGRPVGGAWRPHGLRHTAITEVLARTGNIEAARVFAGHVSIATTQRYLDETSAWEELAVQSMAKL